MAYMKQIEITPSTITNLTVVVKDITFFTTLTLDDFTLSDDILTGRLTVSNNNTPISIYSQGYEPIITTFGDLSNSITLTPTSDYIKTSDGTNDYYVKDNYSRQFGNDLLDILSTKADSSDIPAAQVNSDWNSSSGVSQILNKPILSTVATSGDYNDLTNKPTIPAAQVQSDWNESNTTSNAYIKNKPTIPSTASDVGALPDTTKYGKSIDLALNTADYKLTISLKDQDGTVLNSKVVDFPLESVVVSGSYDNVNKKVILTLQNGLTINFSVADLVAGLQSEITSTNKLDSDLVDDTNQAHKFVSTSEKTTWNGKQDNITDLSTIRSGASAGATAVQPNDLSSVATSGSYNDLSDKPIIPLAQIQSDWNVTDTTSKAYIKNKPTIPSGVIVDQTYDGTSTNAQSGVAIAGELTKYPLSSTLANVATSGNYNDLSNKPTIPSAVTESTVSGWGFTKNVGTVTSVNNTQPVNGNVTISIPDTSTLANKDLSNLSTTGNTKFQTPLESGTNIKTVNNTSLLGNGNIDTSEVFIAEYGVTSFADIETAYNAGKAIFCKGGHFNFTSLFTLNTSLATFFSFGASANALIYKCTNSSVWTTEIYYAEITSNKVTSITSSSTDTQYPSAKCVYDELTDKADTDLSNLSSIGKTVIDGQWVLNFHANISSVTSASSTTIDISSYLPDDNYIYEVMVYFSAAYGSANGGAAIGTVPSPYDNDCFRMSGWIGANAKELHCTGILPVDTERKLYTQRTKAMSASSVHFIGYRRIGTNT